MSIPFFYTVRPAAFISDRVMWTKLHSPFRLSEIDTEGSPDYPAHREAYAGHSE